MVGPLRNASHDALVREVEALRRREAELRQELRRAGDAHTEAVRRLEVKLSLDGNARRVRDLEAKLRAAAERAAESTVLLENHRATETALRDELAVLQQMIAMANDPGLRAAAESTVRVREVEVLLAAADRQRETDADRIEQLGAQTEHQASLIRELEEVRATYAEEVDILAQQVSEAEGFEKENAALRDQVADLEPTAHSATARVRELTAKVAALEDDVDRHRVSWQQARQRAEASDTKAAMAVEEAAAAKAERDAAVDVRSTAVADADALKAEVALLRRQEAVWHDEHAALQAARAEHGQLLARVTAAESQLASLVASNDELSASQASLAKQLDDATSQRDKAHEQYEAMDAELAAVQANSVTLTREVAARVRILEDERNVAVRRAKKLELVVADLEDQLVRCRIHTQTYQQNVYRDTNPPSRSSSTGDAPSKSQAPAPAMPSADAAMGSSRNAKLSAASAATAAAEAEAAPENARVPKRVKRAAAAEVVRRQSDGATRPLSRSMFDQPGTPPRSDAGVSWAALSPETPAR